MRHIVGFWGRTTVPAIRKRPRGSKNPSSHFGGNWLLESPDSPSATLFLCSKITWWGAMLSFFSMPQRDINQFQMRESQWLMGMVSDSVAFCWACCASTDTLAERSRQLDETHPPSSGRLVRETATGNMRTSWKTLSWPRDEWQYDASSKRICEVVFIWFSL